MIRQVTKVCFLLCIASQATAIAQGVRVIPVRKSSAPMVRYDDSTKWSLHVKSESVINSPLLRLRDVAAPVDASAPWWDRAGASIIGLMPVDEQEMVVDRARLIEAVARSTAIPDIQWSGASQVRVTFRREQAPVHQLVQPVSAIVQTTQRKTVTDKKVAATTPCSPAERERITRLLQIAVDRYDIKLREAFDIKIDPNQPAIDELRDLRQVDSVAWESTPIEGVNQAKIIGMNSRQAVTAAIEISFAARPLIVVAREGFRRGYVLTEADLVLMPAGRNVSTADVLTEIRDAVGMQVQSALQKGAPVARDALAPVTVIERGDLVEVHVVGGGITIATGAKSLAAGAQGDLIPIETLEPRKKLMARVAGSGVVEILTRPPKVR